MILILGSSRDDTLFFEASLSHPEKEMLFDHYPFVRGRLFNQEIGLLSEVYTEAEASALTLYLMQRYFVLLVFSIGTCFSYTDDLEVSKVAVSEQVAFGDVDQSPLKPVNVGQIPSYPAFFRTPKEVMGFLLPCLEARLPNQYEEATFISTNAFLTKKEELDPYLVEGKLFGLEKKVVLDCTSAGIAMSCELTHTPFVSLKVIEAHVGEKIDYLRYNDILKTYTELGKVILSALSTISSDEILQEGGDQV